MPQSVLRARDPHASRFIEKNAHMQVRKRSPGEKCEVSFLCPACGGNFVHVDRARTHIDACCPDLLVGTAWERLASGKSAGPRTADDTLAILQQGALTERHNWYRVLHLAFRSGQQEYRGGSVAR